MRFIFCKNFWLEIPKIACDLNVTFFNKSRMHPEISNKRRLYCIQNSGRTWSFGKNTEFNDISFFIQRIPKAEKSKQVLWQVRPVVCQSRLAYIFMSLLYENAGSSSLWGRFSYVLFKVLLCARLFLKTPWHRFLMSSWWLYVCHVKF